MIREGAVVVDSGMGGEWGGGEGLVKRPNAILSFFRLAVFISNVIFLIGAKPHPHLYVSMSDCLRAPRSLLQRRTSAPCSEDR